MAKILVKYSVKNFTKIISLFFLSFLAIAKPTHAQLNPFPFALAPQTAQPQAPAAPKEDPCKFKQDYFEQILREISSKKTPDILSRLPQCFTSDRKLILKAVVLDPKQFQYASEDLQEDQIFVMRLLKTSPDILQYAAPEIRANEAFMQKATYISRDSLQFASWKLLDNKLFMQKMIDIDSRNYKFASDRIKEIRENAQMAFTDNGLLLEFAPEKIKDDIELVRIAVKSNSSALQFASERLQKNNDIAGLARQKTSIKSLDNLRDFLQKNYIVNSKEKNVGANIGNKAKFFPKSKIIDRNYVIKWQTYLDFSRSDDLGHVAEERRLISADSRNYQTPWRADFKKYPTLIKKIEKFFHNHNIPANTVDNLSTTFLWKIKSKPLTLAFNLYLLRESTDSDLGPDFVDATSITAIVQEHDQHWEMTIVEVILDSEIKVDVPYENGHKKYLIWDLHHVDKKDQNPKIIFRVEDKFDDYFSVFEEQNGGKYQEILNTKSSYNE